jgi:hypothetical protein
MVNLVIWSFGSTLRAEVSARSACGSREDCAELDSFPQKMRDLMCVNDAPSLDDFEPKRALVRFFDDNTESGDEVWRATERCMKRDSWRRLMVQLSPTAGPRLLHPASVETRRLVPRR